MEIKRLLESGYIIIPDTNILFFPIFLLALMLLKLSKVQNKIGYY